MKLICVWFDSIVIRSFCCLESALENPYCKEMGARQRLSLKGTVGGRAHSLIPGNELNKQLATHKIKQCIHTNRPTCSHKGGNPWFKKTILPCSSASGYLPVLLLGPPHIHFHREIMLKRGPFCFSWSVPYSSCRSRHLLPSLSAPGQSLVFPPTLSSLEHFAKWSNLIQPRKHLHDVNNLWQVLQLSSDALNAFQVFTYLWLVSQLVGLLLSCLSTSVQFHLWQLTIVKHLCWADIFSKPLKPTCFFWHDFVSLPPSLLKSRKGPFMALYFLCAHGTVIPSCYILALFKSRTS